MESDGVALSPQFRGCSNHLSPSAQATLSKHLPKLSAKRLLQKAPLPTSKTQSSDVACLTDICSYENLPEVEIFSLLEEQIPKYKVRSDILTDFAGYSNEDWFIPSPALKIPSDGLGLTKEQTRETLNYFFLCGNRVSQMTRAYDDIEAVTRLLEEKEKDLELTVQIGKELLTQNNSLETRVAELENELKASNDDRSQLLHELHKKNELISVLTSDDGSDADTPTLSKSITLELLQKKITSLQDENKSLKQETSQLAKETDDVEEKERKLMQELTAQLNDANGQYENLNLELERLREENRLQHEQIVSLTARLSEAEMRLHQLTNDNDEHITLLNITKENQNSLALELVEFKQRYQEVCALLQEAQEQLRKQRKRVMQQARTSFPTCVSGAGNNYLLAPESLQSELMESSLYSENSLDSGIQSDHSLNKGLMSISQLAGGAISLPSYKRAFDTVRHANKVGNWSDQLSTVESVGSNVPRMCTGTVATGSYGGMGGKIPSYESLMSADLEENYPSQPAGVPGAPGAKDLEQALKRLTPGEILARRAMLSYESDASCVNDEISTMCKSNKSIQLAGFGLRTPDSIMSTGSSGISLHGSASSQQWRLPEKLQIVKPLEGSQTLHHWSRLATPSMGGVLEERPGVAVRGGRNLEDLGMQLYTLSDVEEDIISEDMPGKQFDNAGCTYTFTTSLVMHPADDAFLNDLTFLSQSQISSRMASASTSRQPSCPPTPHAGLSRKNSCSTFSVNLGLASMLNERGIKAVTPSAINTPAGPNFTPTVTPCNSPEGSPTRCMSPEPLFSGLLSSGADLVRRKLIGIDVERQAKMKQQKIMLSRLERRALRSLKLVEKVESIGLENIISASHSSFSSASSIASDASSRGIIDRSVSPLKSLKQLQSNANNIVDDLHFDRQQIKGVLHKGLHLDSSDESDADAGLVMHNIPAKNTKKSNSITTTTAKASNESQSTVSNAVPLVSATDTRLKQMQRQKSRRQLKNGLATAQRSDLGTIGAGAKIRNDLGKVVSNVEKNNKKEDEQHQPAPQSITQAFVGSVSSLLFGRKGGWL